MDSEGTLELAGRVHAALEAEGIRAVVIGAVALAAHGYIGLAAKYGLQAELSRVLRETQEL